VVVFLRERERQTERRRKRREKLGGLPTNTISECALFFLFAISNFDVDGADRELRETERRSSKGEDGR
jgi:hypothetical protein